MEKGLKRRPLKIAGEAWLIALATMFAIFLAVAAAGGDAGQSTHESMMTTLRAVDVNHASLQRDVLQTRAGLLRSYDPLVTSVVALRDITARVKGLLARAGFGSRGRIEQLLLELQNGIDADEQLVEQFKTRNALLQNSIGVFGQTLTALHQSPDEAIGRAVSKVGDLGNLMMRFATKPDAALETAIRDCLGELAASDAAKTGSQDIHTLVTHAEMILAILPVVDAKISAVQASGTPARAQQLQAQYLEIYGEANSRAAWSRVLLGATAISLCLYVFVLVYRLRDQTERLKRKLHYEGVIAGIKAEIANSSPRDFPDLMDQALTVLSRFFEADACGLAILNAESIEIKDIYRLGEQEEHKTLLVDFAQDLHQSEISPERSESYPSYRNLLKPDDLAYTRDATVSGIIVGVRLPDQHAATLLFLFDVPRPKVGVDEIALMQATAQTLAELIENRRSREEKEALENRLEHAQRLEAVGTLAGGIAHEFNNVLGAILGYGEMALQMLRKPSLTRHYVEEILVSGERAKHIVDQILTFSRKRERARKPFDVVEAVSDILPLLQVSTGNKVVLTATLAKQPAVVEGSPIEIHQIAMNLCKNAMEASARGQEVEIEVNLVNVRRRRILSHGEISPGAYVCLSVRDHGPGIPESVLAHIFEPFFTTKSQSGGTGLGLSTVHGSVSGLGGSMHVHSAPGFGTRFELFFPASNQPPLSIKSFFDERSVPTGNGQRVIILERDKSLLEMYEEKIAALGYEPLGCSSLDAVLPNLGSADTLPDLVVVDSRSLEPSFPLATFNTLFRNVPYLVLLDLDCEGKVNELHLIGARTLKKPFSSKALAHAIFDCISPVG